MGNENLIKNKKDKTLMIIIGVLSAVLIILFVFFLVEKKENRENWRTLITAPIGIRRKIIVTSFAISYYFTELIIHCFSIKHRNNVDDNK